MRTLSLGFTSKHLSEPVHETVVADIHRAIHKVDRVNRFALPTIMVGPVGPFRRCHTNKSRKYRPNDMDFAHWRNRTQALGGSCIMFDMTNPSNWLHRPLFRNTKSS